MNRPIEKLIPYMNKNSSDVWYPEVPFAISLDSSFIERLEFLSDDRVAVTRNATTQIYQTSIMNQFSVWKVELVE